MRRPLLPILLLCCAFPALLCAQSGDLTQDRAFFDRQLPVYQRWLDHAGLGATLHVHQLAVEPERLSLYLAFPYQDIDSVINAWRDLKAAFEAERPLTLEEQLFYKMTALLEAPQAQADLQLYDTYDTSREPLFFRGIYFADGQVRVEEANPRSEVREISLRPVDLGRLREARAVELRAGTSDADLSAEWVYGRVLAYARERYEQTPCPQRQPRVETLQNDDRLRFEVIDLCKEVLVDETNPRICGWLDTFGYPCNWIKREWLTFTVTYEPAPGGATLTVDIDGKVGSGIYETVRRGGYLPMEVDFDDYLERYADRFAVALKQALLDERP